MRPPDLKVKRIHKLSFAGKMLLVRREGNAMRRKEEKHLLT